MIEGLFISASGMLPKATRQEAIANNLANIEVSGFKRDSIFLREMRDARKRLSGDYPDWRLNRIENTWTDFEQGKLRETGSTYNLAINGKGFFAVRTPEGVQYTRNGNFSRDRDGVLVTSLGYPVLDVNGEQITIPRNFASPIIDASGMIRGRDEQLGVDQNLTRLQVVDFPALYDRLAKAQTPYDSPVIKGKDGYFIARPNAQQVTAAGFQMLQGYVEESNVEPVLEMVRMIDLYRAYEADQRAIQVQDGTLDRAVNEVGNVR